MLHRRSFLQRSLGAGLVLALPSGLRLAPWSRHASARGVVIIQLTGGNDALNTVVPYGDDRYHRARPALRIPEAKVEKLDAAMGYAPELSGLAALHREGKVAVVQGVGMPRPDRSHFVSLDRWHTGEDTMHPRGEGWLGRALADLPSGGESMPGLALGSRTLPRLLLGGDRPVAACERLEDLVPAQRTRRLLLSKDLAALDATWGSDAERDLATTSTALLRKLDDVLGDDAADAAIPGTQLGLQLRDVLRLLRGGLPVPAVFATLGGFDTHAQQDRVHPTLLREVDGAVSAFFRALATDGRSQEILILIYSEFGRRVRENGSRGTDHGSAAPVFLLGGGLPGGLHGPAPDLGDLDQGDVKTTVDFRRILAQALHHLGHPKPPAILGPEGRPFFA